jgi:hypothetical protein
MFARDMFHVVGHCCATISTRTGILYGIIMVILLEIVVSIRDRVKSNTMEFGTLYLLFLLST